MVCHLTKPSQPHRHLFVSFLHQIHKRGEVVIFVKDVAAAIASIRDVVNKPTSRALDVRGIPDLQPQLKPLVKNVSIPIPRQKPRNKARTRAEEG